jgi:hypothetical protein
MGIEDGGDVVCCGGEVREGGRRREEVERWRERDREKWSNFESGKEAQVRCVCG